MARVRIRYSYEQYNFSKKATEYSRKMAFYKKRSVRLGLGFFLFCMIAGVLIIVISFMFPNMNEDMVFPLLVVSMILGVILSIGILRYHDQYLINKRDAALKRDLAKLQPKEK